VIRQVLSLAELPHGCFSRTVISSAPICEHIIAHLKNWKILSHRYRGPLDKLGEAIRAIVTLHFFRYA
jgi:hypothetical protein